MDEVATSHFGRGVKWVKVQHGTLCNMELAFQGCIRSTASPLLHGKVAPVPLAALPLSVCRLPHEVLPDRTGICSICNITGFMIRVRPTYRMYILLLASLGVTGKMQNVS